MAMIIDSPLTVGPLDAAENLSGKEGYAAIGDGSGNIALADGGEDESATVVGVISSVSGSDADSTQQAVLALGHAYVRLGEACSAFSALTCAASGGDADWVLADAASKLVKAIALQAGSDGDLVKAFCIGTSVSAVA